MTEARNPRLTQRDREILRDVIGTYILTGEPVSSRSLAKLEHQDLSAASIRNVLSDLEEGGYLLQPHSSSGRVPTRRAYHLYVEALMESQAVSPRERRYIEQNLKEGGGDGEKLVTVTSHLLSELSHQIGVVLTPALGATVLKTVDFVQLSGSRVLCVVVSETGFVDNKVIELEQPITREELVRITNYLNENFSGMTLLDIRDRLIRMMAEERAQVDRMLANTIALARRALEDHGPAVLVEGTSALLSQPELADIDRVRRLLDTFSDKARLLHVLNRLIVGQGVRVIIGEDSDLTGDLDFSLVATTYGVGERPLGTLGIFGPSRMEYQRVVPLVTYLGETLSRALEHTMSGAGEGAGRRRDGSRRRPRGEAT